MLSLQILVKPKKFYTQLPLIRFLLRKGNVRENKRKKEITHNVPS